VFAIGLYRLIQWHVSFPALRSNARATPCLWVCQGRGLKEGTRIKASNKYKKAGQGKGLRCDELGLVIVVILSCEFKKS